MKTPKATTSGCDDASDVAPIASSAERDGSRGCCQGFVAVQSRRIYVATLLTRRMKLLSCSDGSLSGLNR